MPERAVSRRAALLVALNPEQEVSRVLDERTVRALANQQRIDDLIRGTSDAPDDRVPPPMPRHPAGSGIFLPDVPITGSPEVVRTATRVLDAAPALKRRVKSITTGPTKSVIQSLFENELTPEDYPASNLLGQTNYDRPAEISLNPRETPQESTGTLMHELTHVAGDYFEDVPSAVENLWRLIAKGR